MASPWRDPRTGIFHLRKRVPARYRPVAGPGEVRKISLGTADRKAAEKAWPEALAKWQAWEAEWERMLAAEALTPERAQEIAAGWAAWLANGGVLDMGGEDDTALMPLVVEAERTPAKMARMNARIDAHTAEALTLAGGIAVTPSTLPLLRHAVGLAALHAYTQGPLSGLRIVNPKGPVLSHFDAFRTTLPEVAEAPAMPPPEAAKVTFKALFDAWKAMATVKGKTVEDTRFIVNMLKAFVGHDDATRVAREDMLRWREATKAGGKTNNTWNNRLSMLRQVFEHGAEAGLIAANPADNGLRLRKNKTELRLPYTDDEAKRILEAARKETSPSLRWAHWVMAFTGMRVGEVLQLHGADVKQDPISGVWFLDVNEASEDKSVKNATPRHVPLHPALIAEGFLDYARSITGPAPLFPDKGLDPFGQRGGRGWNLVGEWVRKTVGITDKQKAPNHSWRHRMEDELRAAEVIESDRDAIIGHARKTVGRTYGVRGEALARLHRGLAKVPVPAGL
jgi:integrase